MPYWLNWILIDWLAGVILGAASISGWRTAYYEALKYYIDREILSVTYCPYISVILVVAFY